MKIGPERVLKEKKTSKNLGRFSISDTTNFVRVV